MKFDFEMLQGEMAGRVNRFTAGVILGGKRVFAHIPTSGRLTELLQPGMKCYLRKVESDTRKTAYDLLLVEYRGGLVHINAIGANKILAEAVRNGELGDFNGDGPVYSVSASGNPHE
jgi:sugar fermentation stimulation protein A